MWRVVMAGVVGGGWFGCYFMVWIGGSKVLHLSRHDDDA